MVSVLADENKCLSKCDCSFVMSKVARKIACWEGFVRLQSLSWFCGCLHPAWPVERLFFKGSNFSYQMSKLSNAIFQTHSFKTIDSLLLYINQWTVNGYDKPGHIIKPLNVVEVKRYFLKNRIFI